MNELPFTDSDLQALDAIWPIGRQLVIPDGSTVLIAGAYKGRYMHYIAELYPKAGLILGFEPQKEVAQEAFWRTHKYQNCIVVGRALGTESRESVPMGEWGSDGCSLVSVHGKIGLVSMVEFSEALKQHRIKKLSCFICNMEGYEYELLPHIFRNNLHKQIDSIAVQFHPESALGEQTIRVALNEYYKRAIQSPGWEYWLNP